MARPLVDSSGDIDWRRQVGKRYKYGAALKARTLAQRGGALPRPRREAATRCTRKSCRVAVESALRTREEMDDHGKVSTTRSWPAEPDAGRVAGRADLDHAPRLGGSARVLKPVPPSDTRAASLTELHLGWRHARMDSQFEWTGDEPAGSSRAGADDHRTS